MWVCLKLKGKRPRSNGTEPHFPTANGRGFRGAALFSEPMLAQVSPVGILPRISGDANCRFLGDPGVPSRVTRDPAAPRSHSRSTGLPRCSFLTLLVYPTRDRQKRESQFLLQVGATQ